MKKITPTIATVLFLVLPFIELKADVFYVNSQLTFNEAHNDASMNDTIIWEIGTYSDIYMNISKDYLNIRATIPGGSIFRGVSRANITGDNINFEGVQFIEGNIGTQHVINVSGSYINITQVNIRAYTSYKYLIVRESSQYVNITYCNFENRLNLDDQNILSILVDPDHPGYHKIQNCSFKNFEGIGNDMGIEPIRIGLSTQSDRISRTLVEHCYFTHCDGDGEIISNKARQNVYRNNTFEDNTKAELVLRHGSENIVYGNFFLNGKGGVRVREGQDQYIYNNYFFGLTDRAIFLQNEESDPLDNINIAFNTIVNCDRIRLGGGGDNEPTNIAFSNNIFANPENDIFDDPTGNETWIGNIGFGDLGMSLPPSGIMVADPLLSVNSEGFWGISENSPARNAAEPGFESIPQFEGIEMIDNDILFDLMGQNRPANIAEKDLGCHEYPHNIFITPMATEENTGPDYNTSEITGSNNVIIVNDLINVFPNPAFEQVTISLENFGPFDLTIEIVDAEGQTVLKSASFSGKEIVFKELQGLSSGVYSVIATRQNSQNAVKEIQVIKFVKF
ncbi:MAG: chondroitinase-B domain-containing protein [Bacteroidota bacterium]